jgi:ribonuclease HII
MLDYSFERRVLAQGDFPGPLAGLDEAGRGPVVGPVVAAAVILDPNRVPLGLDDSKRLSPAVRDRLEIEIKATARSWAVAFACPGEIARLNVIGASFLAMRRALDGLNPRPRLALVDGPELRFHFPRLGMPAMGVVGGDARAASIAAASILAKTARDRLMRALDDFFPGYGFAENKGYGRPALEALRKLGPTPFHRWSWNAVRQTELLDRW